MSTTPSDASALGLNYGDCVCQIACFVSEAHYTSAQAFDDGRAAKTMHTEQDHAVMGTCLRAMFRKSWSRVITALLSR
jgi:hypothetical protein